MERKYRTTKTVIADNFFYWISKDTDPDLIVKPDYVVDEAVMLLSKIKVFGRNNVFIQYKGLAYRITIDMAVAIDVLSRTDRRWKANDSDIERLCSHLDITKYERAKSIESMGLEKYISDDGTYEIVDTIMIEKAYDEIPYKAQISLAL